MKERRGEGDMITGEQVKQAMIAASIESVDHHKCGFCGFMTRFIRVDDRLFFDAGCYCTRRSHSFEPRSFDDAAYWINMQSSPDVRERLAASFGVVGVIAPSAATADTAQATGEALEE